MPGTWRSSKRRQPVDYYSPAHWNKIYGQSAAPADGSARRWLRDCVMAEVAKAVPAGGTLLDVACGDGFLISEVSGDLAAIGADYSAAAVALARTRAPDHAWLQADATNLPIASQSVDAAICVCGLWAISDPLAALAELNRVLRPGGIAVLHLWSGARACRLITIGAAVLARTTSAVLLPASATGPFELTRDRLQDWAGEAGFKAISWQRHVTEITITEIGHYWTELAGVAQTAHAHYQALLPQQVRTVNRFCWRQILAAQSPDSQSVTLPLACELIIAYAP
jgi:SAM-dependent methyltransferase